MVYLDKPQVRAFDPGVYLDTPQEVQLHCTIENQQLKTPAKYYRNYQSDYRLFGEYYTMSAMSLPLRNDNGERQKKRSRNEATGGKEKGSGET